jgi:hypothetical protein
MTLKRVVLATLICVTVTGSILHAQETQVLKPDQFEAMHTMFKPQAGESRWMEIDWYPSIWEARQIAAAQGKPIFMMAGSGGAPAAGC